MRALRSPAVSMSGPAPLSSGCESSSRVLDAWSVGLRQLSRKTPPEGTRRLEPIETSPEASARRPSRAEAPKSNDGR